MELYIFAMAVVAIVTIGVVVAATVGGRDWFAGVYDRIVIGLLIFQYVFVNLAFSTYTQNIVMLKDIFAPLLSFVILLVWVCGDLASKGRWTLPRHGAVGVMTITILFYAFSVFHAAASSAAVEEWASFFGYFIQTFAVIRFAATVKRVELLLLWILIANVIMTGYGLSQLLGSDLLVMFNVIPDWGRGVYISTHGNPNFYAGYLITTWPIFVGMWLITRNPLLIVGLPFLVLLNLYEVQKAESRGAVIATGLHLVALFLGIILNIRNLNLFKEKWRKYLYQGVGAVLAVGVVLTLIVPSWRTKAISTASFVYHDLESIRDVDRHFTNQARLVFWQMAIDSGRLFPWTGRGIGGFNYYMPEMRPPFYHRKGVSHNTDRAHNEYFETFSENGVIGLSLELWILLVYLLSTIKALHVHRKSYLYPLILGVSAAPWGVLIQSLFDPETRWTGNGVTLWLGLGLGLVFSFIPPMREPEPEAVTAMVKVSEEQSKKRRRPAPVKTKRGPLFAPSPILPSVAIVSSILIGIVSYQCYFIWMADNHLRDNMAYQNDNARSLEEAEKAREMNYANVSNYYKLAYAYLSAGQLDRAMVSYRILQAFAPNYAQIHINLSFLDDQMGYRSASAWERSRAAAIEDNTRNHRDAAIYWLNLGYPARALGHLRHCFTIERDRDNGNYQFWMQHDDVNLELAQIYMNNTELKDRAIMELRRALQFNPGNTRAGFALIQLLTEKGDMEEVARLRHKMISADHSASQFKVLAAEEAVAARDYGTALNLLSEVAFAMEVPLSGQTPSQTASLAGNQALNVLKIMYEAGYNHTACLEMVGWIYACQGRYHDGLGLLQQVYNQTKDPRVAERIAIVKASLGE